ncbi:MAG: hypothetical protein QXZ28_00385 [Candidatus Methanomethylicaceae archaeon]
MKIELVAQLLEVLAEELEAVTERGLLPPNNQLAEAVRDGKVNYMVPEAVRLESKTRKMDLSLQWCARCGSVWDSRGNSICNNCKSRASVPPVWYVSRSVAGRLMFTSTASDLAISLEDSAVKARMGMGSRIEFLHIKDPSRPVATLYGSAKGKSSRLPIEVRKGTHRYLMGYPSEEGTKPVSLTVFAYSDADCSSVQSSSFPAVKKIEYCSKLFVLQATVCYRVGCPTGRSSEKFYVFEYKNDRFTFYVRHFETEGIIISVEDGAVERANLDRWSVLHTIAHSFLSPLPMAAGLESSDFAEAIMCSKNAVAVFDNVKGGVGGVRGVFLNSDSTDRFFSLARQKVQCPNECLYGCKACLFTDSCYMLNFGLDRYSLLSLGW